MTPETQKLLAEQQLKNIAKLLNGRIIRKLCKDQSGNTWRSITVEYEDARAPDSEA